MKELLKKQKNRKNIRATGFTLVETLVGLLIFTVAVVALMSVLGSGISTTTYAKQKLAAQFLAQEGIECVRNVRDKSILSSNPYNPEVACTNFTTSDPSPVCDPILGITGFTRDTYTEPTGSPDSIKIFSSVSWVHGSGQYTVTFSEHLFNWVE